MHPTAIIGCALAVVFWGSAGIFDKLGVRGVDPLTAVLVRMFFGTSVVFALCLATGRVRPALDLEPKTYLCLLMSALLGGLIGQIAYFAAIKLAPASQVVPITATYPVVAAAMAVIFLREQPTLAKGIGIVLVVIGLALVSSGNGKRSEAEAPMAERAVAGPHSAQPAPPD